MTMDRTARNLELARIMFDGYHHAAERGYVDIWKKSDFAGSSRWGGEWR